MNQIFTQKQMHRRSLVRFASILLIVSAMMLPRWAAAQSIKINVHGAKSGQELTGSSLANALQGVQLDTISEISVLEGNFTADDWNFLRDNRSVLKFRHFRIQYEVSCADIPDTQEGQPYFANIEHLYVGIHPSIKRVGNYAFAGLDQFDHFQIDRFEEVGEGAFKNCTALRFFNGPYVKSIGAYAFAGCSMLESIVLSWTPPAVGVGAFPATLLNNPQLTLVGNSGHDITGDSLSLAMLLYSADDGYNHTTKTWHGFPINIGSIRGVAVLLDDQPTPYIGTTLESALTPYVMAQPDPILACGDIRKLTVISGSIVGNDWQSMSLIRRFALHIVDAGRATYKDQTNAPYPMPSGMYELVDTNSYDWDMASEQFEHSNLTRVHLGKVASLKSTFVGSSSLRQAILPKVTLIEGYAFADCEALTDIQIPKAEQILDRSFAGCTALEHIDLPELTTLNYGAFVSCDRLTTLTLPKLQTIVADYITSNFPINISLLRLPATPPVFKDKDGYDFGSYSTAKEYYDRYQYPAKRYIELIDANGNLLTGDALNAAIANYKADVNWDETTQTWCGWTLVDGSSTLLYQLSAAGHGAQIDLPFSATTVGTKVKVDVYGPMPHYISRPRSLNVYKTGDANATVPFTESVFTDYVVLSFDMPAHDVTVEVNYTPNVMQLTLNGSIQFSGLSLEQCLQGVAPSSVKSLTINSANVFHQNDWDYLANTLTELEHFRMADNIDDLQEYQGDFTRLTKLKVFDAPITTLADNAFLFLQLLEEVNLPKLINLKAYVFLNTSSLHTFALPSVTTLNSYTLTGSMAHTVSLPKITVINDYALSYAVNLTLLQLGATPPTVGTDAFEGCPAVRYLQLVDANGTPLTGNALTTAIANYKNDTGWNDTEQLWHGFKLNESGLQLYHINAVQELQKVIIICVAMAEAGESITATVGAQTGYILRGIKVYRTGHPEQQVSVNAPTVNAMNLSALDFTFEMPAHDVTVEAVVEPNNMEITVNNTFALQGSSLKNAIGSIPYSSITSLSIDRAKFFGSYASSMTDNDWPILSLLENLEHLHITAGVDSIMPITSYTTYPSLKTLIIDNLPTFKGGIENSDNLHTVSLPMTKIIESGAFSGDQALATLHLPVVETVEHYAFYMCGIESLHLPKVRQLGDYTFQSNSSLASASLPRVEAIGSHCFADCNVFAFIQLGATPPTVGQDAFTNCALTRYLQLVDANGAPLTGDALSAAIANYQANAGWNATEQKWRGWSIMPEATVTHESICQGEAYTWTDGNGNTYTQAGAYVDPSDIANPKTLILSVLLPSSSNIATQICQGESYTLNGIDYYTRSGVYTATLQSATGCDSIVTLSLKVHKPVSHELSHIAEGSYTWNGETYTTSGEYVQTLSAASGCDSTVTLHLTITQPTKPSGVRGAELESLAVAPNPTTGELWITMPEFAEGNAEVLVYNAAGQLLQRVAARAASTGSAASRLSIDLSGLPAGLYIVRSGNAVAKVVKQ